MGCPSYLRCWQSNHARGSLLFFPSFPGNEGLCPVASLRLYLKCTESLRGGKTKLFLSFIKPHRAVTSSSIARWLRTVLEQAGIDTSMTHQYLGPTLHEGPQPQQLRELVLRLRIFSKQELGVSIPEVLSRSSSLR